MIDWGARALERAPVATPETFKAPLFRSLIERFDPDRRYVVLDLGAARTQTISLLGQFRCRLDIADLDDDLERLNATAEPEELAATAEALLPRTLGEPTDVVLCWDILNYLERPALGALMARIAARAHARTIVHALIVYSQTHMSTSPGSYIPLEEGNLLETVAYPAERVAPRYSPDDLCRHMVGYSIERAMLLRNGMQEFLFHL